MSIYVMLKDRPSRFEVNCMRVNLCGTITVCDSTLKEELGGEDTVGYGSFALLNTVGSQREANLRIEH